MKKATVVSAVALSGIVLSSMGGVSAFADDINSMDTKTHIEFSGHTPNPNPDELDLIWVPTTFEFGQHEALDNQNAATTYKMENPLPKYTIVQDKRSTVHSDWKVNAVASEMKATTAMGEKKLNGAQIDISKTALKQYTPDDNTIIPESNGAITNAPGSWSNVIVQSNIALPTDGTTSAPVMNTTGNAVENGKYAAEFGDVQLSVPQGVAQEGDFNGTVTWTLSDAV
ncbi:hypothetical protein A5881_000508 [Enterococcus termitis]|nr:hypothetical protein A5881_000715 [Enterococcus termitis]